MHSSLRQYQLLLLLYGMGECLFDYMGEGGGVKNNILCPHDTGF